MNYLHKELSFPSSDGKNNIHAEIFIPSDNKIRGVVQISHGMRDYIGRYALLVEEFTAAGFVVAGNDHLGHGETADPADWGFIAAKGGWELLCRDTVACPARSCSRIWIRSWKAMCSYCVCWTRS